MSKVTVSIVVPVFNGEEELEKCLAGIGASAMAPLETIVVDDGSTDGSRAVAERFGARVLGTGGRCGPAKARNLGAREAKGDVVFTGTRRPGDSQRWVADTSRLRAGLPAPDRPAGRFAGHDRVVPSERS